MARGGYGLPPGPRLPRAAQTWAAANRPLELLEYGRNRFGKTFTIRALSQPPLVYFSDAEDVQEIFDGSAVELHPGEGASLLLPILGEQSFLLLDEDDHLFSRKVVMPSLHETAVQQHADLVTELTEREMTSWPRDVPFALHPRLRALVLDMTLRVVFGPSPDARLPLLRDRLLDAFSIFSSVLLLAPLLRKLPPGRARWARFQRQLHEADELIYELIDERGEELTQQGVTAGLLRAAHYENPDAMSRRALRDNIVTMLLAGHETTAATLAWSFQALAHNPGPRERLVEEIEEQADNVYLKATIYEALRYRPVFIFTAPRVVKRELEIGGLEFSPPTYLFGAIYLVHHDPAIYPEPDAFQPERFLGTPPETPFWIPWGGGRKRCPGRHLALMELEIVVRTVLRRLAIHPAGDEMERAQLRSLIVAPQGGCRLILHDRR